MNVSMYQIIHEGIIRLLPTEVHDFVARIIEKQRDKATKLVFADYLKEQSEDDLEFCFRWMALHDFHPEQVSPDEHAKLIRLNQIPSHWTQCWQWKGFEYGITQYALPKYIIEASTPYWGRRPSFIESVAVLAERLAEVRAGMTVDGM